VFSDGPDKANAGFKKTSMNIKSQNQHGSNVWRLLPQIPSKINFFVTLTSNSLTERRLCDPNLKEELAMIQTTEYIIFY